MRTALRVAMLAGAMAAGVACAQAGTEEPAFANSGSPAAQAEFLTGLGLLHNFEYPDAAEHFRRAEAIDAGFAMAYWGEAMSRNYPVWHDQDLPAARAALGKLGPTAEARAAKAKTEREKRYLGAAEILFGDGTKEERDQRFMAAMAELHAAYPDDVDATAFYALSILGSAEQGRDFTIYMRAAAVLEEVFPKHPRHPGVVHYLIHCYDDPVHAPLGLRPARIYAEIAPEAAHAQHMTSHIFLAMGMWDEVVKANEIAVSVTDRQRAKAARSPVRCGHYITWLEYGYLQQGRVDDARRTLEGCRAEADAEAAKTAAAKRVDDPDRSSASAYAAMRAIFVIETKRWDDPVLKEAMPAGERPLAQFTFDYTGALAALERGDKPGADAAVAKVDQDRQACLQALEQRKEQDPQERQRVEILAGQLKAMEMQQAGKSDAAVAELRRLAALEHGMPLEFGPPFVNKPTEELLGEVLLASKRRQEAGDAFRAALAGAPGRRLATEELAEATTP